jgi:hypothetical protein
MSTPVRGQHRITLSTSAKEVWGVLRNYGDLSWGQGIDEVVVEGNGVGMLRKVRTTGSPDFILERLTARNDTAMTLSYAIEGDGIAGLSHYNAHVRVEPCDDGCIIHWQCLAEAPDDDVETMQPFIQRLAEGISSMFARQFTTE